MEKKSTLLLALLFVTVMSAVGFGLVAYGKDRWYGNPLCQGKVATVQHGPRLKWRTIHTNHSLFFWIGKEEIFGGRLLHESSPWLLAGSFDDPDKEKLLLFWDDKRMTGVKQSLLLDVDGSIRPVGLPGLGLSSASTFDHDFDGIDSILPDRKSRHVSLNLHKFYGTPEHQKRLMELISEATETVPLLSIDGEELQGISIPASATVPGQRICSSDFDKDGDPDMLLMTGKGEYAALDAKGNKCWTLKSFKAEDDHSSGFYPLIGDFDGNGQNDVLLHGVKYVYIHSRERAPQIIAKPASTSFFSAAADLDGDGCDDIISSQGWYSLAKSTFTPFSPHGFTMSEALTADIDADGKPEVVHLESIDAGIQINNADGSLRYQESFGNWCTACFVLRNGNQDYIVLQLSDRVLIYP